MRYWGILIQLATATIGLLFPAYKSIEALESAGTLDDSQWLAYWLLYALITVAERYTIVVLGILPFFAEARLAGLIWLACPPFNGAAVTYKTLRPYLMSGFRAVQATVASAQGKPEPGSEAETLADARSRIAEVKTLVSEDIASVYNDVAIGKEKQSALDARLGAYEKILGKSGRWVSGGIDDSAHGTVG